jgi:hypothetical protein
MPGTTPNRGYPYATATDPFDVPGDLQRLAEAVDVDMQLLDDSIIQRPFAKVSWRSATKQVFVPDQPTECQYDYVDFDPRGIWSPTRPTRLVPTLPGLWGVWGAFEDPAGQASVHDLFLRANGADLIRSGQHSNGSTSGQMITLFGLAFLDGIDDYFTMTYQPLGGTENFKSRHTSLACFRLTAS